MNYRIRTNLRMMAATTVLITVISGGFFACKGVGSAAQTGIEALVKPSDDEAQSWIAGQEITTEEHLLWFNKTEPITPGKLQNWQPISVEVSPHGTPTVPNEAVAVYQFGYTAGPPGAHYIATIRYSWSAIPPGRKQISTKISGPLK